ncbi:hypothetical protein BKA63DRAFT_7347 [Paraphoma chrysanthemicola]|nr:hypothetical protein BKA63DRAFT_7347 [Paraphoma chrysanthemicola]
MDAQKYDGLAQPDGRQKRKFNLVKCDRCRFDRQSCTPSHRVWPTKCNRCVQKDFPCSEGRRILRDSKYTARVACPLSSQRGVEVSLNSSDDGCDDWMALMGFYKIMVSALLRLRELSTASIHPFAEKWLQATESSPDLSLGSRTNQIYLLVAKMERMILDGKAGLPATIPHDQPVSSQLASRHYTGNIMGTFTLIKTCYFCHNNNEHNMDPALQSEIRPDSQCNQFILLQRRILAYISSRCLKDHNKELHIALDKIEALHSSIPLAIESTYPELKTYISSTADPTSHTVQPFLVDELGEYQLLAGRHNILDCLGRDTAHRWLDSASLKRHVRDHLEILETYVAATDRIDSQDDLGRTLLHIVCLMDWKAGARVLLQHGANPTVTMQHGILPLHIAAASGSLEMCELLLEYTDGAGVSVDRTDKSGFLAMDYAAHAGHTQIIRLLSGRDKLPKEILIGAPNIEQSLDPWTDFAMFNFSWIVDGTVNDLSRNSHASLATPLVPRACLPGISRVDDAASAFESVSVEDYAKVNGSETPPTQREAAKALKVVMSFLQSKAARDRVKPSEYVTVGKLIEKYDSHFGIGR